MLSNKSLRPICLRDYITTHMNSNRALFYNKALKIENFSQTKNSKLRYIFKIKSKTPAEDQPLNYNWNN